jgi:hypothetical protein
LNTVLNTLASYDKETGSPDEAKSRTIHRRNTMPFQAGEFSQLALLIQRMLDAELLLDIEGTALLAEADAAHQSQKEGNAEEARQHIARLAHLIEALVKADTLALSEGRAVIKVANQLLDPKTDAEA